MVSQELEQDPDQFVSNMLKGGKVKKPLRSFGIKVRGKGSMIVCSYQAASIKA